VKGLLWRLLAWPLRLAAALVILFEEWGWEPLQRAMVRIGRLPLLRQLEALIARLPPPLALVVFLVPGALLLPVKLGALWLVGHGQRMAGVALIVVAKVVGTALAARIFALTRPALMRMPWFAALYARWTAWKDALLAWVRASALWRGVAVWRRHLHEQLRRVHERLRRWWQRGA
jgi:hypothetical protein